MPRESPHCIFATATGCTGRNAQDETVIKPPNSTVSVTMKEGIYVAYVLSSTTSRAYHATMIRVTK